MPNPSDSPAQPPAHKFSRTQHVLATDGGTTDGGLAYTAYADWQILRDRDKPVAELFHVAYLADDQAAPQRPLTFVFNGGPGAASAYLHMGALGPKRVRFNADGSLPKPPVQVVDNAETWLTFTDLVFIDPVGTGFSRSLEDETEDKKTAPKENDRPKETPFWSVDRDLKSLGEFIQGFLSRQQRWLSPIFIAGESYGGFRVARLVRQLQQDYGVGLSGAILISPALEFGLLGGSDYNVTPWATVLPSFAAAAAHHGLTQPETLDACLSEAEAFARRTYLPLLAMGDAAPPEERQAAYRQMADMTGLPVSLVQRQAGRVDLSVFARELLRSQHRVVGLYDASITAIDPFPDRPTFDGADPTLDGLNRLFTGAINSHLRDTLGVETDLIYHLLNFETFKAWQYDLKGEWRQGFVGSVDEFRAGMALNPHMKVWISHGIYDLVTPYFGSNHLVDLMRLDPELRSNLTLKHYLGGHMFYAWDESREAWLQDMKKFYQGATG
ncbi:MAG: S10 family peptidase [Elainellaceae cyanobacterium]